jgi:hypothetical protein
LLLGSSSGMTREQTRPASTAVSSQDSGQRCGWDPAGAEAEAEAEAGAAGCGSSQRSSSSASSSSSDDQAAAASASQQGPSFAPQQALGLRFGCGTPSR